MSQDQPSDLDWELQAFSEVELDTFQDLSTSYKAFCKDSCELFPACTWHFRSGAAAVAEKEGRGGKEAGQGPARLRISGISPARARKQAARAFSNFSLAAAARKVRKRTKRPSKLLDPVAWLLQQEKSELKCAAIDSWSPTHLHGSSSGHLAALRHEVVVLSCVQSGA